MSTETPIDVQAGLGQDIWRDFQTRLRAYVSRRVEAGAVEDVVGDILLLLVRHRDRLAVADEPAAWVFRVAANAISDHHRRRAAETRALTQYAAEIEQNGSASGDASNATEIASCLTPVIRNLPQPYAEALLLTDIAGLNQTEAAARLGLSTSGMKSRVQRGRAKLKQAILRCCAVALDCRGGMIDCEPRCTKLQNESGCTPLANGLDREV